MALFLRVGDFALQTYILEAERLLAFGHPMKAANLPCSLLSML